MLLLRVVFFQQILYFNLKMNKFLIKKPKLTNDSDININKNNINIKINIKE